MPFDANAYPNTAGSIVNELLAIVANVDSTSTDSGSMQVIGGSGVSGNVWANEVHATEFYASGIALSGNLSAGNIAAGNVEYSRASFDSGSLAHETS